MQDEETAQHCGLRYAARAVDALITVVVPFSTVSAENQPLINYNVERLIQISMRDTWIES
jgi:hypothetical protein